MHRVACTTTMKVEPETQSVNEHIGEGGGAGCYLLDASDGRELVTLEDVHVLLGHVQVQRKLSWCPGVANVARPHGAHAQRPSSRYSWDCRRLANSCINDAVTSIEWLSRSSGARTWPSSCF